MDNDIRFMRRALSLARRGRGKTSPNPLVGAVIVKNGRVVTEGYHEKAGGPHAEVVALKKAGQEATGATLYITLEPCCHTKKKTPPCTDAIIGAGVGRVVVAMEDPNPQVSGQGMRRLADAGIDVVTGILEEEARILNEAFCTHITTGLPFVTLKIAETLDGRIATASGESKWITGEASRKHVHRLRNWTDAILVGVETVIKDDPLLTVRAVRGRSPLRVVVDSTLRTPLSAKLINDEPERTIVATTTDAPSVRADAMKEKGVEVLVVAAQERRVFLPDLIALLGKRGITSIMIEGGSEIAASALKAGIVDKVLFFVAPKIMGGKDSVGAVGGSSPASLFSAVNLENLSVRRIGEDLLVDGYIRRL